MKWYSGFVTALLLVGPPVYAQTSFDRKIAASVVKLECMEPSEEKPVTLVAATVVERDSVAVIVKTRIAAGWHIYQYVPATAPYIPIELILKLPKNLTGIGKWEMTRATPSVHDKGVMIYEREALFVRKALKTAEVTGAITAGLYYQTCNLRQCLQPVEETFELTLKE